MGLLPYGSPPTLPATFASQGKVRQTIYNVKDYGALGDGSTDDTTAIAAAITAASGAGGGTVFLPPGTYKTTAALVPVSNVKIQGSGSGMTTVAPNGAQFSAFQNLASVGSPTTDIEICDLKIDGTNVTNGGSYSPAYKGIYMQYSQRLKIHGVYVYNTLATGIGTDFLVDSQIDRCVLDTCGRSFSVGGTVGSNGIGIGTGGFAVESWIVSNCIAKNCGNVGLMCEAQNSTTNSEYMTFADCLSYGNGTGFLDSGVSRVSFNNCWTWANTLRSGFLVDSGDILIANGVYNPQDVYFNSCFSYGNTASSGFVITDNQTANHVTLGYNVHLANCVSAYNSVTGFDIQDYSKVSLNNCQAYNNGQHGVLAFSDSAAIPFNDLSIIGGSYYNNGTSFNNTYDGIRIGSSGAGIMSGAVVQNVRCYDNSRKTVSDGAMTASSAILTSTTAGFIAANVGKSITVNGAGSAGGNLTTTIASWQSLTQVTLTVAASTTVTGATVAWGTSLQRYGVSVVGTTNTTNIRIINNDLRNNTSGAINAGAIPTLEVRGNMGTSTTLGSTYIARTTVADANYTVLTTDSEIAYTSLSTARTITLPTAAGVLGQIYTIKDESGGAGTNNITIATTSAQTIDGAGSLVISINYGAVTLYSDGANWWIVSGTYQAAAGGAPTGAAGGDLGSTYPNPTVTATHLASALPVAQGGTGVTSSTGSGSTVLSTSPTLTTPIISQVNDANGNPYLKVSATASAIGGLQITNNVSGSAVTLTNVNTGNSPTIFKGSGSGLMVMRPGTDSTDAIRWQNAAGTNNILDADTTNTRLAIGGTAATATLDVRGSTTIAGNLTLNTAGGKLNITTGSNASVGTATLSGGTVTVSTTAVTSSSKIFLTDTSNSITNVGTLTAPLSGITAGTSFTVTSTLALDTSTFNWLIIN